MFEYEYATDRYDPVPAGLDEMAPGPELAAVLASIDVGAVSGYDQVVVLKAQQRMVSHHQAQAYAEMAAVVEAMEDVEECVDPMWAPGMAAAEIRVALRLTRRAADDELGRALELRRRLPLVWDALAAGGIDPRRARTILWCTAHLSDAAAQMVVERVLARAGQLTTGQLAALIRRRCIEVDPEDAQRRYDQATSGRRVVTEATVEGTANLLGLDLAPDRVAAVSGVSGLLCKWVALVIAMRC